VSDVKMPVSLIGDRTETQHAIERYNRSY